MTPIRVRALLAEGKTVLNGWSVVPGPFVAEIMGSLGWDALTIDVQHGVIGYPDMVAMLQAISRFDLTPMVRLAGNDPVLIGQALDAGAMGVICPLVSSPEEAMRFVSACRYPPLGCRSSGATRAMIYAGFDYGAHANAEILKFAMIETREALDRVDEIAAVEGLDTPAGSLLRDPVVDLDRGRHLACRVQYPVASRRPAHWSRQSPRTS